MAPDRPSKPLLSTGGVVLSTTLTTTLYTPPSAGGNSLAIITSMLITNSTGVARTVTLYRVPPSGVAGIANVIVPGVSIAANKVYGLTDLDINVPQGWTIQGGSDGNTAVTWTPDGVEIV